MFYSPWHLHMGFIRFRSGILEYLIKNEECASSFVEDMISVLSGPHSITWKSLRQFILSRQSSLCKQKKWLLGLSVTWYYFFPHVSPFWVSTHNILFSSIKFNWGAITGGHILSLSLFQLFSFHIATYHNFNFFWSLFIMSYYCLN